MKFIDEVTINARSGRGGPGCVSFRRESKVPRGGPDGGDGGQGGHIVFTTDSRLNSLLDLRFKKNYFAQNGLPGQGNQKTGSSGEDLVIKVPPGTVVKDISSGKILADLGSESQITLLKGGRGGKGNSFYKTSVHQAPVIAQKGEEGLELELKIELKLIADVGIIGLPNAGKSTLISKISAAKPKIADYPFTTLVPNLGVVQYKDGQSFVAADIPGLIPGASQGQGLGLKFLKHIERTKVFIHVLDILGEDTVEDFKKINFEMSEYDKQKKNEDGFFPLSERPQLVVLNKIDTVDDEFVEKTISKFKDENILAVSAISGKNIDLLKDRLAKFVWEN